MGNIKILGDSQLCVGYTRGSPCLSRGSRLWHSVLKLSDTCLPIYRDHCSVDIQALRTCCTYLIGSYFKDWNPVVHLVSASGTVLCCHISSRKWDFSSSVSLGCPNTSALLRIYELL